MELSRDEVLHIARLARLAVSDDEVALMQEQLSNILDNFKILQQVDTTGIPPTAQSVSLHSVMAYDEVQPSLPAEDVLSNAPRREGDYFRVKAVLE